MINKKIKELEEKDPIKNSNILERYNAWISNISPKNKNIFENIFCDIEYYSELDLRNHLQELYNSINKNDAFLDETLVLYVESQDYKFNSSMCMTYFLIESNNLHKNFCDIETIKANRYNPKNFILCDDFIGTGTTLTDFIKDNIDIFRNKNIFVICIHCMNEGIKFICNFAKEYKLNISILNFSNSNKYLSDDHQNLLQNYLSECRSLQLKYPLGYENSESLIVTYRNTPNNTLGAIWENTKFNNAIFPRQKINTPKCRQMNAEKKRRRKERYINGTKN